VQGRVYPAVVVNIQGYNHWITAVRDANCSEEALEMGIFPTRILLATDGSEEADLAARRAIDLAGGIGSELHLIHVGQLPNFLANGPGTIGFDRTLYVEMEQESREVLRKLTWRVKVSGGTVAGAHLRMGIVGEEVVGLAEELEADLIVMGSRSHGGVRRAIEGSTSDFVARHARCPVMIVPADKSDDQRRSWRKVFSFRSAGSG
jgi:nucleotide-binding universal stress UspA family protein